MPIDNSDLLSFGELLRAFRIRTRLTQQQLAEQLGVRRNTIGTWERGDFLPGSKGTILELVRLLRLNEEEARRLLEASLTALSPHWSVPFPRNPFFTGREMVLEALHAQLGLDQAVVLTQSSALHGLGGIGKTQIALEYAYRHALEYSAVFWIGAETEESIAIGLLRIAETLRLPERDEKDQQRVLAATQHWLSTHGQWLLIWDNVEDLELLTRFLPTTRSGAMLLTTRRQVLGTLARGLDLVPMQREEAVLFLLRRAKMLDSEAGDEQVRQLAEQMPAQYTAVADLVEALGRLPLALDQAGAYLEATQCGLPAYLDLFCTRRALLLQQRGEGAYDHPASVSTTFTLALTATAERHPAVRDLLQVCALLQPDTIPEEVFRLGAEHLSPILEAVCRDPLEWNRVVAGACSSSLLRRQPEEQTLSMHRLVQAVLLDTMTEAERKQWTHRVTEALDTVFPEILPETEHAAWEQCERLLPHTLLCLQQAETREESLAFASLAYKVAQYLRERGRYAEAEPLLRRALRIREQRLGPEHPEVALLFEALAGLSRMQGKYAETALLYQRALHIREQHLGPDHPEVASSLNNLAGLYWMQGKRADAELLLRRALHIREQCLGPDHFLLATSLDNLGLLTQDQGKYAEAERLFQRALRIQEQSQGPDHQLVTNPLSNLAGLYRDQGKYAEAESLLRRALRIREQHLGPEHPEVALLCDGLAELFRMQGELAQAEPLYQRALSIQEQVLGPEHPEVAYTLNGLANLCQEQDNDMQAEAFYQRALSIWKQHLGPEHPETAQTLHDLAVFRQKQGQLSEALLFAKRALSIRSQTFGGAHPKTGTTHTLYAQLVQEQADAGKTALECKQEELPGRYSEPCQAGELSLPRHGGVEASTSMSDPLQGFLDACCELHPRAWCRSADLWQAYKRWAERQHERYPLSRGAFITQLKAHGCRADRTMSARIWRGIALLAKNET